MPIFFKLMLTIVVLIAFMIPGFILKKMKLVSGESKNTLSTILLYVCQPAMILSSLCIFEEEEWTVIRATDRVDILINFAITAVLSVVAFFAIFLVCKLIFIKAQNKDKSRIFTYIATFSNCAFLGVPFIEVSTDGNVMALLYLMVFNLVFAVMVWTLGVYLMTGSIKNISAKKVLLNPTIIATVLALILFFVPEINIFMYDAVSEIRILPEYLSSATAPLSMIIVGISLADQSPKALFCERGSYIAGALRLIAAPIITFAIALLAYVIFAGCISQESFNEYIFLAPVVGMAMSPAATVVAMAELYKTETKLASAAFILNTLFSIITVPSILTLITYLWGLII